MFSDVTPITAHSLNILLFYCYFVRIPILIILKIRLFLYKTNAKVFRINYK